MTPEETFIEQENIEENIEENKQENKQENPHLEENGKDMNITQCQEEFKILDKALKERDVKIRKVSSLLRLIPAIISPITYIIYCLTMGCDIDLLPIFCLISGSLFFPPLAFILLLGSFPVLLYSGIIYLKVLFMD